MHKYISNSPFETQEFGNKLAQNFLNYPKKLPLLVKIDADLGVGKTAFVQGIGKGLEIEKPVTSPSYTYVKEYTYNKYGKHGLLVHLDAWRVDSPELSVIIGLEDNYLKPNNLVVIEWPQNYPLELTGQTFSVDLSIEYLGEQTRQLSFSSTTHQLLKFD